MALRVDERATDFREIDRFENGIGWIAHSDETMQRASHALEIDGEVWVIDPVDAARLDDLLAEFGEVAGVVVLFGQHARDAGTIANRHGVPVYLPAFFDGVSEKFPPETAVARFDDELADTGLEAHTVVDNRFWQEVTLSNPADGTLVVPESVGTADYFRTGGERLGVHPMRRLVPPRAALDGVDPERILVGHGPGVTANAGLALEDALSGARWRTPRLYANAIRELLPA